MKNIGAFSLRTKFLLASFIPTLVVLTLIVSLFSMQFNRLAIQNQVDDLLNIPAMLENTISSPDVLNYRHLLQNGIFLLDTLRSEVTGIAVYAEKEGQFQVIVSTQPEDVGKGARPNQLKPLRTGRYETYQDMGSGQKILRIDAPLFLNKTPVAVVSIFSTLLVQDAMMAYLKNLILVIGPLGGALLWAFIYLSFKKIFLSRLANLSAASREISAGQWPMRIPVKWKDEMGELEATFNQMSLSRQRAEEALEEQAIRDTLTKLYNRRYFNTRIEEEIERASRNQTPFAVLICDLDFFKHINDSFGHQTGDEVLKQVARNLGDSTRGSDLIFRWGGDEFVVILGEPLKGDPLVAANRIREGIHQIRDREDKKIDLSIGIALFPRHAQDAENLIRVADRALYIAKKGGGKIHVGEEEFHLNEEAIVSVFQPIMDIQTQAPYAYEALSRDPQGKNSILNLFKKYQAIGQLLELKMLCFKGQIRDAVQGKFKRIFINVDFELLSHLDVIPIPDNIEIILEISELEALEDIEKHLIEAKRWRQEGYQFAVDDFGAGFISLPFLSHLVPEYIKIDRSAILRAESSAKFKQFLSDLVLTLRNYTQKHIIAEGIETEAQLKVLEEIGIHLIQGFLLGKPIPLEEVMTTHDMEHRL